VTDYGPPPLDGGGTLGGKAGPEGTEGECPEYHYRLRCSSPSPDRASRAATMGRLAERMFVDAATGQLLMSELALCIGEVEIVSVAEYVRERRRTLPWEEGAESEEDEELEDDEQEPDEPPDVGELS